MDWSQADRAVRPRQGWVDVWRWSLHLPSEHTETLESVLSTEETTRASRYRVPRLREEFVAGRGVMRLILGQCLGRPAASVSFAYGPHGKPFLADPGAGLEFNLAHSRGQTLLAVGRHGPLGIDLESHDKAVQYDQIVTRFFSTGEQAAFNGLPESERREAFFRGWTRKEAWLKALGTGLTTPLDSFDVPLGRRSSSTFFPVPGSKEWLMGDLDVGAGFSAALVLPVGPGPPAPRVRGLHCELDFIAERIATL